MFVYIIIFAIYVIHTVGPKDKSEKTLERCYLKSLDLVKQNQLLTVAFPCIATGVYGFPQDKAAAIALTTVREFLQEYPLERVIFCLFTDEDVDFYEQIAQIVFPPPEP